MSEPDLRDPRLDEAYRELRSDAPPAELDERIRAAARRAVGAGPQSLAARERSWASRWRVPLALAASVVVVVTLTLMMQEQEQRASRGAPAPAAAPPAALEDRVPARAVEEDARADRQPTPSAKPVTPAPAPAAKALAPPPAAAPPAAPSGSADSLSRERAVGDRPARAARSAPEVARSPEDWIEEIRRLKAQGRDAEAATELAGFRRRHPDYPLPADLAR